MWISRGKAKLSTVYGGLLSGKVDNYGSHNILNVTFLCIPNECCVFLQNESFDTKFCRNIRFWERLNYTWKDVDNYVKSVDLSSVFRQETTNKLPCGIRQILQDKLQP